MLCISIILDTRAKYLINKVNNQYNKIFKDNCFLIKIFEASFILINEALTIFIIYTVSRRVLGLSKDNDFIKIILLLVIFFIVHYLIGVMLLFYNNLQDHNKEGKTLTGDFLLSYFLIATAIFFIFMFYRETVRTYALSFLVADVISYLINIKLLIMFMIIGKRRYREKIYHNNFFVILLSAVIIVFMLILNLFIGVVIADGVDPGSFSNCPGVFDLFYYTVVTFTTIGFGDIVPISRAAKVMAVFISATSILCMSVFLSSIYSVRSREK